MTEQEWLQCADPTAMLKSIAGTWSARKLRLFAVSCCRHNLGTMIDVRRRKAVEVAELFADGMATEQDLMAAHVAVNPIWGESESFAVWASALPVDVHAICEVQRPRWIDHAKVLRDIIGNPFRPIIIDATCLLWNDATVPRIAQSIYDDRQFQNMPILADALEEAGCTNAEILNHCRQTGEHVRGCWVVDLILGKK